MKKPLSRIEFVAKKLGKLNEHIVLDLGCRDMSLKNYLDPLNLFPISSPIPLIETTFKGNSNKTCKKLRKNIAINPTLKS